MVWYNAYQVPSRKYQCGYCGNRVAANVGYYVNGNPAISICICPFCEKPSYFAPNEQVPGVVPGSDVKSLPGDIEALYAEARRCFSLRGYTAAVIVCRKLLMNIAVAQGAPGGQSFIEYVEYLAVNGFVPPNGKAWVDHIRKKGNEANHEIILMTQQDAEKLISFTEMLLKFIYEFPSRIRTVP